MLPYFGVGVCAIIHVNVNTCDRTITNGEVRTGCYDIVDSYILDSSNVLGISYGILS